eukprot:11460-Eustigmatos_ZCMA.PRE.1
MVEQPVDTVTAGGNTHIRQRGTRTLDPLSGRDDLGLPRDGDRAAVVCTSACQLEPPFFIFLADHRHADGQ